MAGGLRDLPVLHHARYCCVSMFRTVDLLCLIMRNVVVSAFFCTVRVFRLVHIAWFVFCSRGVCFQCCARCVFFLFM